MKYKRNPVADELDAFQSKSTFTIIQGECKVTINKGDWIGQDGIGNIKVFSDETFKVAYTAVEGY